jgi:hypothetical protein
MTGADLDYVQPFGIEPLNNAGVRSATPRQIAKARQAAEKAGARVDESLAALRRITEPRGGSAQRDD